TAACDPGPRAYSDAGFGEREGRGGYSGRSGRGSLDLPARRGPPGVAEKIGARPELVETLRAERQTSRRTRHFYIPAGRRPDAPPPSHHFASIRWRRRRQFRPQAASDRVASIGQTTNLLPLREKDTCGSRPVTGRAFAGAALPDHQRLRLVKPV